MAYRVGLWLLFATREAHEGEPGRPSLEALLDDVMERLLGLNDVEEPSIGGSLAGSAAELSVTVREESIEDAVAKALACMRTALHAAHGETPHWPVLREGSLVAEPVNDPSAARHPEPA